MHVQPGPTQGSLFIGVSGTLTMDGDTFHFAENFVLCPNGNGGFYCHNDMFQLFG